MTREKKGDTTTIKFLKFQKQFNTNLVLLIGLGLNKPVGMYQFHNNLPKTI